MEKQDDWNPQANGCGPKGQSEFFENFLQVLQFLTGHGSRFESACRKHDRCYADCSTSKSECDNKFLVDMRNACDRATGFDLLSRYCSNACAGMAKVFYEGVNMWGDEAFENARKENCECVPECPPK